MKARVVQKGNSFYSEYWDESARIPSWKGTYRNFNCVEQNRFNTLEKAQEECRWFKENFGQKFGKTVWEEDI